MNSRKATTWGDIYRRHLARGEDHGSAAWAADQWEKRQPRGQRAEEARREFLAWVRNRVEYWASLPDFDSATGKPLTVWDRCDGVAFSLLLALDGGMTLIDGDGVNLTKDATLHDHPARRP